jgi:hypothetical protein
VSDYDGSIFFKDWLPDQPDLNNPGLTEALNVLPYDGTFKSYLPLTAISTAGPSRPLGALYPSGANGSSFFDSIYAGFQNALGLYTSAGGWTNNSSTAYSSTTNWDFEQFDNLIIATNGLNVPQRQTLGATSSFTALAVSGTAPAAKCVGIINRFVFLGDLEASAGIEREHMVQWSAIDAPTNWPTPDSATATATQSGLQELPKALGPVREIYGGDQHGLIFQAGGITRVTYAGPPTVFSFDTLSKTHGLSFRNGSIAVNNLIYFISLRGFCVTDGVEVVPIGDGKVDRYFLSRVSFSNAERVHAAHDAVKKLVVWNFPSTGATAGQPNELLIYNYEEKRWSRSNQVSEVLFTPPLALPLLGPYGFDSLNRICAFSGTPGTAVITTGETEPNPGGFSRMQGIKPLVDVTLNAVTVAIGTRNDRSSSVSYTSETTANSRSGFATFRSEARYHRARLTITGTFNAAQGLEYEAVPSGYT